MQSKVRVPALAVFAVAALLGISSRDLKASDPEPADSPSATVISAPEVPSEDQTPLAQSDPSSSAGSGSIAPPSPSVAPAAAVAPVGNAATAAKQKGFWARFAQAYYDDWHPSANPDPPKYRGDPMPESSPPYPFNVWPIGGTVWIGYPNATNYPLTTALYGSDHWQWLKKANIQVYGWANAGMNLSTSTELVGGKYANSPASYNQIPNSIQLDQLTMYIERVPDTVQTDHFDWGFRFTALYGMDYRFTTADGYFSQQLLHIKPDGTVGNQYGADPVMVYLDLYFPHVAEGMILRIGRYVSLPDIEAQLAPNNYTYTHSLTYTYDCYTQTGVNATIKVSNFFTLQAGISPGCDTAPWKPSAQLTGNLCGQFTFRGGRDDIYLCANSLNSGNYAYNNLAAYYATWYHKINAKWHMDYESWYQYESHTPNIFNPAAASLLILNANGAWCKTPQQLTCYAPEWTVLNYTLRQLKSHDFLAFRDEFFDDLRGQRTGIKGRYVEYGLSWNHWIGSTMVFRPELRWEHNFDNPAYDGSTRHSQFMFAGDVIWFY
jgi:Putative beta-barrel porin-2, OmpL-like. bbp2